MALSAMLTKHPRFLSRKAKGPSIMKIQELRKKSKNELNKFLLEKREHLRKLRFDCVSGKLKSHREIRNTKKQIAQTLTILRTRVILKN